jgi:hypothetical protein
MVIFASKFKDMSRFIFILIYLASLTACENAGMTKENEQTSSQQDGDTATVGEPRTLSQDFKDYWYDGVAEISSYDLKHSRYGEIREGHAVMIFVTEPFDRQDQVKADQQAASNVSVLKLNATRNFNTGIYPYKIMSSTFLPLESKDNAIKVATSIQEWCGHTYMQLNRRGDSYDGTLHSYFQSEGNRDFQIDQAILENQIPSQLRIDPMEMPTGSIEIIPSTEYLRLVHQETRSHAATASMTSNDSTINYTIDYKDLDRSVSYELEATFPYKILSWVESYPVNGIRNENKATIKKTLRTPYWRQNSNKYSVLRDSLQL